MKKEHVLLVIVGLFILSYVLDSVVDPLTIQLASPYSYLRADTLTLYPFTTASVFIKAIAIFLTPLLLFSLIERNYIAKAVTLLVLIGLMQLYSLQDIATGASRVPLEWALSISIAGIALAIPMIWYFMLGILSWLHVSMGGKEPPKTATTEKVTEEKKDKPRDGDYLKGPIN